jgi:hypothetical protein
MAIPPVAGTIAGAESTAGNLAINPDQLKLDVSDRIWAYDPEAHPMLAIVTGRSQTERATEVQFKWLEDSPIPEWVTAAGTFTIGATTITLAAGTGAYVLPNTVIKDMLTGEAMYVTGVATDTLTVTRGWGGTTAAASSGAADTFLNIRNAQGQGTSSPTALQTTKTSKTNFCQIVKDAVSVTKTEDAVDTFGGNERVYQRAKKATEHARNWEQILIHGIQGSLVASQNNPVYTTGGLDYFIQTNVLTATGTLSESQWMSYLGSVFRFSVNPGRKRKVLFASQALINTINSWGTAKLQVTPNSQAAGATYGIDIREYVSGFGQLSVIFHPLLENGAAGTGYIIDMDGIAIRYLRKTMLETNIQAPDADVWKDQYITEAGMRVAMELSHGRITGVTF